MTRRILLCFLISCLLLVHADGQQTQSSKSKPQDAPRDEEQDVVRITTNLVQVDAVVTKDGKQVTDLKPEDFELFEDGRPQTITNFSYISNVSSVPSHLTVTSSAPKDKTTPPVLPAAASPHDVRRTIALVIDDLGMSFESMAQVRRQARKFVDEKLEPNDLVAIIRTGGEVGALQQFTTDKRVLYSAIEHLRWHPCSRTGLYVFAPVGSITPSGDSPCGGSRNIRDTLRSLKFIVQGMRDLPGRKSLVLFSDQLPIETQEPGTTNSQVESQNNTSSVDTGDADSDNVTTSYLAQLQKVAELAIRASVVIYSVDTRGLPYTGVTAADHITGNARSITNQINATLSSRSMAMTSGREGSDLIARQTGGFLVRNSNSFGLDRIADDQKGYYLLGYRPSDETFNRKFHHIKLKVKGRGLAVRTREGFYGVSDEGNRELTPSDHLRNALMSPFGVNDIGLRLTTMFTNFAEGGSLLRSLVHITAQDLTFVDEPDGGHKATFDLGIVLFGDNGRVRDSQSRLVTLILHGREYEGAMQNGIVYTLDTPLKVSGEFQFRIALRDQNSSRIGSAGQFIQIPNLQNGRLALSGVVLLKDSTVADQKQPDTSPSSVPSASPLPQIQNDEISSSPAVRQFHVGSRILFACSIYNAQLNPSTHLPQLAVQTRIFRDGKIVLAGSELPIDASAQGDLKRIASIGRLQLGSDFSPGYYVLQIVATDRLANEKQRVASQWIDFEVVK
jgi:VWFA-related protein